MPSRRAAADGDHPDMALITSPQRGQTGALAMARTTVRVAERIVAADGVICLVLEHPAGERLPDWAPGAHVDLVLPNGEVRQYSLCGDRWDAYRYRVAVLREPAGRGGSVYVHDELKAGDEIGLGGPRNNFALVPSARYRFIAGGIGITPILPMLDTAERVAADWQLLYGGRTRASMAFADELAVRGRGRVELVAQDERGLLDLGFLREPAEDTAVYACGPAPLLEAVRAATQAWPAISSGRSVSPPNRRPRPSWIVRSPSGSLEAGRRRDSPRST